MEVVLHSSVVSGRATASVGTFHVKVVVALEVSCVSVTLCKRFALRSYMAQDLLIFVPNFVLKLKKLCCLFTHKSMIPKYSHVVSCPATAMQTTRSSYSFLTSELDG
jgi:hypothetical protein